MTMAQTDTPTTSELGAVSDPILPLFYVKGARIFQRPVRDKTGTKVQMGFVICTVHDGVDPDEVCAVLNRGEPATS